MGDTEWGTGADCAGKDELATGRGALATVEPTVANTNYTCSAAEELT